MQIFTTFRETLDPGICIGLLKMFFCGSYIFRWSSPAFKKGLLFKGKFCWLMLGDYFRGISDERMYYSGGETISDAVDIVEDRYGDEDICTMKLLVLG